MNEQTERFGRILTDAEYAWDRRDFEALERVAKEVPPEYVLCIYNLQEANPCFSITPIEGLKRVPDGFRCVEAHEYALRSLPEQRQETCEEPDRPPQGVGVPCSLEPQHEDGRGIL